jgi:SAM-dependent methyltransferase
MNCRICGGSSFGSVIDLGLMPLVNNLLKSPEDDCPRWPLKVVFCRACSLAQLTEAPPPERMFDEYIYFSSQSQTMVAHARMLVARFMRPGDRVLEIASNDAYLLSQALERGAAVLGIDPARNVAEHANRAGVPTRGANFNEQTAAEIVREWGTADVVFANNVLAHVPDPSQIVAGIKTVLAAHGMAHVEVPSVVRMIETGAFDTIYHEHHSYFSASALLQLFNRHDLCIVAVELMDIHGGSLHLQVAHRGDQSAIEELAAQERELGVFDEAYYAGFASRVDRLGTRLIEILNRFDSVAGYGAAAKGVVLLNFFGLDRARIPWVVDVSPHKQNRFLPGTKQRVVPPQTLLSERPQAALLLAWNIRDEVVRRNCDYLNQGGRFIVPIPEVEII